MLLYPGAVAPNKYPKYVKDDLLSSINENVMDSKDEHL